MSPVVWGTITIQPCWSCHRMFCSIDGATRCNHCLHPISCADSGVQ